MNYISKLIKKDIIAAETMAFEFEKPEGFKFEPGQFILIKSLNENNKIQAVFSIASTPYEPNIMIAMRMRNSLFKNWLKNLEIGSEIGINGPKGKFILPYFLDKPVVFLAGGIGITPIRSIILNCIYQKIPGNFFLFYSNRYFVDISFLNDFLKIRSPNFIFIPTLTREENLNNWKGEVGRINASMILKYVPEPSKCYCYIAGPSGFVNGMIELVKKFSVKDDQIRKDEFSGYK